MAIYVLSLPSPYFSDSETSHHRICGDWQLAQEEGDGRGELILKITVMPEQGNSGDFQVASP